MAVKHIALTERDRKAIGAYAEAHNLRMGLVETSSRTCSFIDRETGVHSTFPLARVVDWYIGGGSVMAGTREGGVRAAATNKQRYGADFYRIVGRLGGMNGLGNSGFGSVTVGTDGLTGHQRAALVGAKGGRTSRRRKADH